MYRGQEGSQQELWPGEEWIDDMDRYDPEVICRRQESGMETSYEAFMWVYGDKWAWLQLVNGSCKTGLTQDMFLKGFGCLENISMVDETVFTEEKSPF